MAHSILPPSSANIWGAPEGCTAWPTMNMQFPVATNAAAEEGTKAHELAAYLIQNHQTSMPSLDLLAEQFGQPIDDEMYDAVSVYYGYIISVMRKTHVFGGDFVWIEKLVACPSIHEKCFGTPDHALFDQKKGHLYVTDYKHGHLEVDAFENEQIIIYTSGKIDELVMLGLLKFDGSNDDLIKVTMTIVQPRAYRAEGPVLSWTVTLRELRPYFNILRQQAAFAMSPLAKTQTGKHCRFCTARIGCTAMRQSAFTAIEVIGQPTPEILDNESLGVEYRMLLAASQAIKSRLSGVSAQVEALLKKKAQSVPGFTLKDTFGNLAWSHGSDQDTINWGAMMGVDIAKPATPITPTQAKNRGIIPEEMLIGITSKAKSGVKVVPDDGSESRKVFSKPVEHLPAGATLQPQGDK